MIDVYGLSVCHFVACGKSIPKLCCLFACKIRSFFKNSFRLKKFYIDLHTLKNKKGTIAQLVEQRTENPCVPGSIPGGTTRKKPPPLSGGFFLRNARYTCVEPLCIRVVLY